MKTPSLLGKVTAVVLFLCVVGFLAWMVYYDSQHPELDDPDGQYQQHCWELKEIQGAVFRFNKCTGEAIQVQAK